MQLSRIIADISAVARLVSLVAEIEIMIHPSTSA